MADSPYDFFSPGSVPGAPPTAFEQLRDQWSGFLGSPEGQGALLSAGLTLMQPRGFAQDSAGQFGQALGAAGASLRENEAINMKKSELESKQDLRAAQADAAGSRAETSAANSRLAGQALDFKMRSADRLFELKQKESEAKVALQNAQTELAAARAAGEPQRIKMAEDRIRLQTENLNQLSTLRQSQENYYNTAGQRIDQTQDATTERANAENAIRLSNQYQQYRLKVQEENRKGKLMDPKYRETPILPFQDWKTQQGFGGGGGTSTPGAGTIQPPPATPPPTTAPQGGPTPPSSPGWYSTPRGIKWWDGAVWHL